MASRDLKLENIMLDEKFNFKLIDLGSWFGSRFCGSPACPPIPAISKKWGSLLLRLRSAGAPHNDYVV